MADVLWEIGHQQILTGNRISHLAIDGADCPWCPDTSTPSITLPPTYQTNPPICSNLYQMDCLLQTYLCISDPPPLCSEISNILLSYILSECNIDIILHRSLGPPPLYLYVFLSSPPQ